MMLRVLAAMLIALPVGAAAHPHTTVNQQAELSLGRTQVVLTYLIAPSTRDGAHMFEHLDTDGDGRLSRKEQSAFAGELLAETSLTVDGAPVELTLTELTFPDRKTMAAGGGLIKVTARKGLAFDSATKHDVALEVRHNHFAKGWFLQPYYFPDLIKAGTPPALTRRPGSTAIDIRIPPN
jgi:hypothetical protein